MAKANGNLPASGIVDKVMVLLTPYEIDVLCKALDVTCKTVGLRGGAEACVVLDKKLQAALDEHRKRPAGVVANGSLGKGDDQRPSG